MPAPIVEQPEKSTHIVMIVYGDPGVGKTLLLGSAEECDDTSPTLFVDFERGTRTLQGKKIDVTKPQTWKEIQDLYEFLKFENDHYKSVCMDSLTEIQKKYSMGAILGDLEDESVDLEAALAPAVKDWMRTGDQMRKLIRAFRDLAHVPDKDKRLHIFFSALERLNEKRGIACPQLSGTLGEDCGALVDFLCRLSRVNVPEQEQGRRFLLTDDHIDEEGVKYLGKSRGGELPKGIWNPKIMTIFNELKNTKKGEKDA